MSFRLLDAVGNTPLVRLSNVLGDSPVQLYGKLEGMNPSGSAKDRPASAIIRHAMETGQLRPGMTVVESSSGNMGIGLAMVCAYHRIPFICVIDPLTQRQNRMLLEAYGATVVCVPGPDPESGEYLRARIAKVKEIVSSRNDAYWPDQYSNAVNAISHYDTMREIVEALGDVDFLFCCTSTCGTIRGCADFIKHRQLRTRLIAVDALGSAIFGGPRCRRLIPGLGAGIEPPLLQGVALYKHIQISALESVLGCRKLVETEAILAGGSSGAVLMAVLKLQSELPDGALCVAILPDRGERYLDTIFDRVWVQEHCGGAV